LRLTTRRYVTVLTRSLRVVVAILAVIAILQLWNLDVLQILGAPGASDWESMIAALTQPMATTLERVGESPCALPGLVPG